MIQKKSRCVRNRGKRPLAISKQRTRLQQKKGSKRPYTFNKLKVKYMYRDGHSRHYWLTKEKLIKSRRQIRMKYEGHYLSPKLGIREPFGYVSPRGFDYVSGTSKQRERQIEEMRKETIRAAYVRIWFLKHPKQETPADKELWDEYLADKSMRRISREKIRYEMRRY